MAGSDEAVQILDRITRDTYTERDVARLRHLISVRGDHNVVQVGRTNVRLDQASNIHIGDRIYRGADADQIRSVLADLAPDGRGSLRGLSGFVITLGLVIALVGMAMFFSGLLTLMGSEEVPTGPPPVVLQGFGLAFVGVVVGILGQLLRGWERPRAHR